MPSASQKREREREIRAQYVRKLSSLNFAAAFWPYRVYVGLLLSRAQAPPTAGLLWDDCCWSFGRERTSQLAPITTFNAVDYIVYIRKTEKKGESSGSYVFIQRGDGATDGDDVSGPLSSVDCTRPTTSITRPACSTLPIRSKSNPRPMMTSSSGRHSSQQSRTSQ